ncbi:MAG: IS1 family transposase [Nonlabens sp.]
MKCKHCGGSSLTKKGIRNHKQRLYCKTCCKYSQSRYTYKAYEQNTDGMIIMLLKESCSVRGISRILKISTKTVLSRMLKISDAIDPPDLNDLGCSFEVDELWTFVGNKSQVVWLTYAIERKSRMVIDFHVGRKSKEAIAPLINKVMILQPNQIFTDKLNIYPSLIPSEVHRFRKYCTNKIERKNLTLRTHIKRLSRKTICFSRERKYLVAHLKIYFWSNNNLSPTLSAYSS